MRSLDLTRPLLRWLYANELPSEVVLVCPYTELGKVPRSAVVVEVPACLGTAQAGLCAQLLASGEETVHIAQECEDAWSGANSPQALIEFFVGAQRWDRAARRRGTRRPEILYLGQIPLPRRMVLGFIGVPKGELSLTDDEHTRELEAVRILRQRGQVAAEQEEVVTEVHSKARLLGASGCTACGVCVTACPHEALSLPVEGSQANLIFDVNRCQGDLQCVQLCPVGALQDHGPLPLHRLGEAEEITLATIPVATCSRCRATHHEVGEPYCQSCRSRVHGGFGATADVAELIERARKHRELLFGSPDIQ